MNRPEDELSIRNLVANYADGVNRYDPETWAATWAGDAEWQLRQGQTIKGREAIVAFWQSVMDTLKFAIMIPGSGQIRISGDQASGRWYMVEIVEEQPGQGRRQGKGAHIVGVYNDHYVKFESDWLIQSRRYHMLYESPASPGGVHLPLPTSHLNF